MGLLKGALSLYQFEVKGAKIENDFPEQAAKRLAKFGFQAIDEVVKEKSAGWVSIDNMQDVAFGNIAGVFRDPYLVFSYRIDERKVPKAVMQAQIQERFRAWLAEHKDFRFVPKERKAEIREMVYHALLSKTLPVPKLFDAVWDVDTNILSVTTLNPNDLEDFTTLFHKTFEGVTLYPIHPMERARLVLGEKSHSTLERYNEATSDTVVDLVRENRWIGKDFQLWLLWRTLESDSRYGVSVGGPQGEKELFQAYLDEKVVLVNEEGEREKRVSVAGPQDNYLEVKTALKQKKEITESTMFFEKNEEIWRVNLKGDTFGFASIKTPKIRLEKDDITDPFQERIAVFYERMHLIDTFRQLFESLYGEFMRLRISAEWQKTEKQIRLWFEG